MSIIIFRKKTFKKTYAKQYGRQLFIQPQLNPVFLREKKILTSLDRKNNESFFTREIANNIKIQ